MPDLFTVCKIEAGRAVLLSQSDFELIEFPAKLLPKDTAADITGGTVQINICTIDHNSTFKTGRLIEEIEKVFSVNVENIKKELGNVLKIENLGCTAAILSWTRPIHEIFGSAIQIDNIILDIAPLKDKEGEYSNISDNCDCDDDDLFLEDYVDFVIKGLKPISKFDQMCRINLPINLTVKLIIKTSVGYFKTNSVPMKCKEFDGFAGIFVLTDLTEVDDLVRLEFVREQGGYINRKYSADQPITAVVTDSFDSELFKIGIYNNLPVVSSTWLVALVATMELPHFEDHLLKRG